MLGSEAEYTNFGGTNLQKGGFNVSLMDLIWVCLITPTEQKTTCRLICNQQDTNGKNKIHFTHKPSCTPKSGDGGQHTLVFVVHTLITKECEYMAGMGTKENKCLIKTIKALAQMNRNKIKHILTMMMGD